MKEFILHDRNSCPICNSTDSTVLINFPDIPVVQCTNCQFIFSSRTLDEDNLKQYYENNFGGERHLQGQKVNASVNFEITQKLVDFTKVRKILDIGTGYGFFIEKLRDNLKMDVMGVELSYQEAKYAQEEINLNVLNTSLAQSGLLKHSYDLVTSFEVIEHTPYPILFLKEMIEYVKPGGYLLVMTDNFESKMARSLGASFSKWIPHTHISHFSALTLKKALESCEEMKFINSFSYTPWETIAKNIYYKFKKINKTPDEAFNLTETLQNEMTGSYKMFELRKLLNPLWAKLNLSKNLDGDLLYFLCQKVNS